MQTCLRLDRHPDSKAGRSLVISRYSQGLVCSLWPTLPSLESEPDRLLDKAKDMVELV